MLCMKTNICCLLFQRRGVGMLRKINNITYMQGELQKHFGTLKAVSNGDRVLAIQLEGVMHHVSSV